MKTAKFLANVCVDTAGRKRRNALMPIPGRASTSADALAGECIGDCVILTVDMTNGPGAAGGRELFPKVVAFFQKSEEVLAVAAPQTRHHHDYKERIQFKNCRRRRVAQGLARALAETKKNPRCCGSPVRGIRRMLQPMAVQSDRCLPPTTPPPTRIEPHGTTTCRAPRPRENER